MHKDSLQAGTAIRVGSTTVLPIERVMLQSVAGAAGVWLTACKLPLALVIRDADGVHVRGMEQAVSMTELRDCIPNLDDLMAAG